VHYRLLHLQGKLMTPYKPLSSILLFALIPCLLPAQSPTVFGYADFSAQAKIEDRFLAVPDAQLAGQHLKILTAEPHLAASPEDHATAEYVAEKFRQPASIPRSFPTASSSTSPKSSASKPSTKPAANS
jgi:hypothetical protein